MLQHVAVDHPLARIVGDEGDRDLLLGIEQHGVEQALIDVSGGPEGLDEMMAVQVDGVANTEGLTTVATSKAYALANYHGVPEALMKKFQEEPLMLKFALPLYDKLLGPALLILGLTILLGVAYRSSLFLLGLLYISLTWGLILINQNDGVAWLGTHMLLIVGALVLAEHNRLAIMKKW